MIISSTVPEQERRRTVGLLRATLSRPGVVVSSLFLLLVAIATVWPHGFGNPDQEDLLVNGLLPELRRRQLIDTDYVGEDFRSNLELPPLASPTAIQASQTG